MWSSGSELFSSFRQFLFTRTRPNVWCTYYSQRLGLIEPCVPSAPAPSLLFLHSGPLNEQLPTGEVKEVRLLVKRVKHSARLVLQLCRSQQRDRIGRQLAREASAAVGVFERRDAGCYCDRLLALF